MKFMLEAFGLSDPGNVRSNNEDYYLMAPTLGLYLVADGMGGAQAGECASQMASETVGEIVWRAGTPGTAALETAFTEANRRVLEAASNDTTLEGMGTTLTAILDGGQVAFVASVGDSRLYVFDEGKLELLTEDQTWVHEVGRALGLEAEQLKVHPMRHVLTMAIGVGTDLRIHSYQLNLRPGMLLLLSSDGLHGVVDDEFIGKIFASQGSLEEKGRALVEMAKQNGGPDNITVVLLRVAEPLENASAPPPPMPDFPTM